MAKISTTAALREARQWAGEIRRWAAMIKPAVAGAVQRGRAQAKANKPALSSTAEATVASLRSMGFKARPAEIAVRAALADVGDDDPAELMRAALRRLS